MCHITPTHLVVAERRELQEPAAVAASRAAVAAASRAAVAAASRTRPQRRLLRVVVGSLLPEVAAAMVAHARPPPVGPVAADRVDDLAPVRTGNTGIHRYTQVYTGIQR